MKAVKKQVMAVLMLAVMALALCSCGGTNADGTYVVSKMAGQDIASAIELAKASGKDITAEDLSKIVISGSDITISAYQGEDQKGTVKVDGEKVTITMNNETIDATLSNGTLTISQAGIEMVYVKK